MVRNPSSMGVPGGRHGLMPATRRLVLQGVAAGAAALAAAGPLRAAGHTRINVRSRQDLGGLDNAYVVHMEEAMVVQSLFPSLVRYRAGTEWSTAPSAAEFIEQVDPTHIRFKLKPGLKWTNGYGEVSPEDVKYSYERVRDGADAGMVDYQRWELLETVKVEGPLEGVIVLKAPLANLWTIVLPRTPGVIVCKKAWEEKGFTKATAGFNVPTTCGPYKLKEWAQGQKFVLERNPDWTGGHPAFADPYAYFDQLDNLVITDDKAAELAFLAGEVDITKVAVSSVPILQGNMPADATLESRPTTGATWLGMNVDHEPFGDIRVRQAVRKAIDTRAVVEAAYFGASPLSTGVIAPGVLGHREAEVPAPDPEDAKALLAEAGMADGFKTTITCRNKTEQVTAAQVIAANLAEIGVEAEVNPVDEGTFWDLGLESKGDAWKSLQLILQTWTLGPDPADATIWFVAGQVGEWNWERWRSDEFTELNDKAAVETDPGKRGEMYKRMMDLMWESAAYVPITHEPAVILHRTWVAPNFLPDGDAAQDLMAATS